MSEKTAIFIDTNVLEKNGFNFDERNVLLKQYKEIVTKLNFETVSVSLIDSEIKQHINEKKELDLANINKHCKWIYELIDQETVESKVNKSLIEYEKFKKDLQVIEIGLDKINPEIVMSKYFNMEYPFESQKKYEFKDAFFLEAVYSYAKCNPKHIRFIVISNDKGIQKAIDAQGNKKIIYFNSIQDFIDSVVNGSKIPKDHLEKFLTSFDFSSQIKEKINIIIQNLEDYNIQIANYECMNVFFPNIIKINNNIITVVCDMHIVLTGEFKCLDYENSYYDNIENKYLYKEYKERSFLGYVCQTVIDVETDCCDFKEAQIIDLPNIYITYESFLSLEDYFKN